MSGHPWDEFVKQLEQETDPAKIAELAKKLNDAMITEAREKVEHRLGLPRERHKVYAHGWIVPF